MPKTIPLRSEHTLGMQAPAYYWWGFPHGFFLYWGIIKPYPPPLRLWTCQWTWPITLPTCTCTMYHNHILRNNKTLPSINMLYMHMYHNHSDFWLCEINHQSQTMTQVPVIYHHGNILIALWHKSNSHEIRFTIEHQFCQKLHRDYSDFCS